MSVQRFGLQLPNHVYYTLNFRNNGSNGEAEDAQVDYTETRNNPYLLEPDLYACSIIRFSLTTATLPIFIPQMSEGFQTTDPSNVLTYQKTVYSVTMSYNGVESRKYVKYIPQTVGLSPSPNGDVNAASTNPYYYVYQIAQFVVMVNNALAECYKAVVPLDASNNATKCPVYINWLDKQTQAIFFAPLALVQEPNYADQPNPVTPYKQLKVWFNAPLFNYFSSFQAEKEPFRLSNATSSNGKHFRFQWWNFYNSTEQTANTFIPPDFLNRAPSAEKYIAINQSYSTVPLMNPVKSIVFTTSLLPILPEIVSAPQTIGGTTNFQNDGNNANVQNVLTDFEVELVSGEETRPTVYYVPSAEYRMVDLQSNQPLTSIQLRVNWRNKFGALIPLLLGTDGNAQMKILFRRRDWQS
jgi:hypothetical protein